MTVTTTTTTATTTTKDVNKQTNGDSYIILGGRHVVFVADAADDDNGVLDILVVDGATD